MVVHRLTLYKCDICSKVAEWNKGWAFIMMPLDIREDMEFHVCSPECEKKLMEMSKKDKKLIHYNNLRNK